MSIKTEHTKIAGINLEPNKKLGYYLVDENIYYNKFQALLAASKNKSQVRWMFNEPDFIKFPWHIEPETSLTDLYRLRAQQLRDRYDYIRVEASGGGDSTTVVYSFLLNNIHLDEVVFRYPKQGEKGVTGDPNDTRCENTLSEWEFAAKPLLNWITTNYPAVKITVHDYTEMMLDEADTADESWIFKTRHYLQPGHAHKHTNTGLIEHKLTADTAKSIAVVYGIDKPKIFIKDNKFFVYFMDALANHNNPDMGDYTNITNEFFYWSPDMPELVAKQAHIVKNWFSMPQNYKLQNLLHWPNTSFATRTYYEQVVKSIVYPDYDSSTFQTIKPTNNIWNEMDCWFHTNFQGTNLYNSWEAGINYLLDNLDEQYIGRLQGRATDISVFESVYYYLGDCNIPNTSVLQTQKALSDARLGGIRQHRHIIRGQLVIY
jgi:hypothetical protein